MPGKSPGSALSLSGSSRGGPGALAGGAADPGPTRVPSRAVLEVGEPAAGGGGARRPGGRCVGPGRHRGGDRSYALGERNRPPPRGGDPVDSIARPEATAHRGAVLLPDPRRT